MKRVKKTLAFLLAMVLCLSMTAMNVSAASSEQDGLEVTLETDKAQYSKSEQITATLTVTNTNDESVSNITMESIIPEGYFLADNTEAVKQLESLGAGESVLMTVTYIADSSDEENPSVGNTNNGNSGNKDDTNGNSNTQSSGSNVQTGDNTNLVFWIVVAAIAGAAMVVAIVTRKKKGGKKLLSLFLCFALTGTMFSGISTSVNAADIETKTISISHNIKIDNTELQLEASVTYDKQSNSDDDVETDVGEISFREPTDEHIVFDDTTGNYFVDNEILVTGTEDASREDMEQLIASIDGTIVGCIEITNDYQVELPTSMDIEALKEIVANLSNNELIENVVIHYLYATEFDTVPNDSNWSSEEWSSEYPEGINWGVEAINAMGAWDHYDEMSYVNVGIIDSMFDTGHEDLAYTKVWNNPASVSSEELNYSERSHGTHVSGTIAACYNNNKGIAGVAPKVTLYGYSILGSDSDPVATDSNKSFVGFMQWKYALANLITSNCKVINVSMGNTDDLNWQRDVLGTFLEKLITKGYEFVIVQSAGNSSSDALTNGLFTGITIPSVQDRIIIVGAIGNNGSHKNGLFGWFGDRVFDGYYYASFSNYGNRVDIVAPGVNIYSTVPDNGYEDNYGFLGLSHWDGTSMAAPHITGIAAMCFSVNPALTGAQVKDIITSSASTTVTDTNSDHPRRDYRVADAEAAVELALETDGDAISPVNPSTGIVMGNVRGYNENHQASTISDVNISAYRITDYDGNLSEYASSSRSDTDGNYELILEAGTYYINIYKEGYLPFAICDVTVTNDQITYLDNVILIADSGVEVSNIITGTVRNALTGSNIDGVTVQLRPGWGNQSGALATLAGTNNDAVTVTDENGHYSLEVNEGCYTAEFIKDGYITGYVNVICTNMNDTNQDAVLTPVLSDNEYRVVLTWSSTPSDLDSHISGPLSTGGRFHVYYNDMSASDNGETVARLDLDDTSSYGPETITLTKTQSGVYKYAVHDYSNRSSSSSTALSMSGAKVELYCGNALVGTYTVPIDKTGTVWNVFEIEGDTIRTINTMENISSPASVCSLSTADTNAAVNTLSIDSDSESKP